MLSSLPPIFLVGVDYGEAKGLGVRLLPSWIMRADCLLSISLVECLCSFLKTSWNWQWRTGDINVKWNGVREKPHRCYCYSVAQSCPTLCDPMHCSTPGFLVHHQLPEFVPTHVHWVSDANQPSHPLLPLLLLPSILSQHLIFQWVSSLHQVAECLCLFLKTSWNKQ